MGVCLRNFFQYHLNIVVCCQLRAIAYSSILKCVTIVILALGFSFHPFFFVAQIQKWVLKNRLIQIKIYNYRYFNENRKILLVRIIKFYYYYNNNNNDNNNNNNDDDDDDDVLVLVEVMMMLLLLMMMMIIIMLMIMMYLVK